MAIKLYNVLPQEKKELDRKTFKSAVKRVLLEEEFYSVEEYLGRFEQK